MEAADEKPTRVLVFAGEVDAKTIGEFMQEFTATDATDGPIEIRIFSAGGDAYGGMGLYDLLRSAQNEVITIGFGDVSSAGFLLFQGGDTRIAAPNCTFLVHPTTDELTGGVQTLRLRAKEVERIHEQYCQVVSARSGMPVDEVRKLYSQETFLTSDEVLKMKLADAILEVA
jgi:ATP-dependent Clp protease protease subunit